MFKSYEEQEVFEKWAFGETGVKYAWPLMMTWNSMHGDDLWLIDSDNIQSSVKKMKEIWDRLNLENDELLS